MIHSERIRRLNRAAPRRGRYVAYWMQASQRAQCNHALEYAVRQANELDLPLVVCFGLTDRYPEANARHYAFMLEGLAETQTALERRGATFVLRRGDPSDIAIDVARSAALLVADRGYLRHHREWRQRVAQEVACPVIQVEADAVVPVESASPKAEYSAATLRPRLHRRLAEFLVPLAETPLRRRSPPATAAPPQLGELDVEAVPPVPRFHEGGTHRARRLLNQFIERRLRDYADRRNDPGGTCYSDLSPYIHFGQISPLEIALRVVEAAGRPAADAFLEQLIVRRELSINHVYYTEGYDHYESIPVWARQTLAAHTRDARGHTYGPGELEAGQTHDPYWNAAMREMVITGKMHPYMRMYWAKKILEWSLSPEAAFEIALALNNRYFLDGRDPNSFAGVAWCFGTHDRPWPERPVFGTVRTMTLGGLERKFDMAGYLKRVADLA